MGELHSEGTVSTLRIGSAEAVWEATSHLVNVRKA